MYNARLKLETFDYIKEHGVVVTKRPVTLKSNRPASVYFDIKSCIVKDPYFTTSIISLIDQELKNAEVKYDTIAGVALGGLLISDRFVQYKHFYDRMTNESSLNYAVVRSQSKGYGIGDLVIGEPGNNVVIIEDVITSGESVMNAIEALEENFPHINIRAIVSIVDRTDWFYNGLESNWFKNIYIKQQENCKYIPLFKQEKFVP